MAVEFEFVEFDVKPMRSRSMKEFEQAFSWVNANKLRQAGPSPKALVLGETGRKLVILEGEIP